MHKERHATQCGGEAHDKECARPLAPEDPGDQRDEQRREVGKQRPAAVVAWLAPRTDRASGVTMREAVKYLPSPDADRLMAAYREKRPAGG